jgi:hypothetical protein
VTRGRTRHSGCVIDQGDGFSCSASGSAGPMAPCHGVPYGLAPNSGATGASWVFAWRPLRPTTASPSGCVIDKTKDSLFFGGDAFSLFASCSHFRCRMEAVTRRLLLVDSTRYEYRLCIRPPPMVSQLQYEVTHDSNEGHSQCSTRHSSPFRSSFNTSRASRDVTI